MKVLAYTSPARGHLFPLVPILDELRAPRPRVALRTLASQVGLMRRARLRRGADRAGDRGDRARRLPRRAPRRRSKRAMAVFGRRAPSTSSPTSGAAIARAAPDALLVDCMSWGASAAAEAWGGPWAQWFPYPLPLASRDVPPFGPGPAPLGGPARPAARPRAARRARAAGRARDPAGRQRGARARRRARRSSALDELFTAPPLLLYMTAEPLEYPRSDWPASVRAIGPCAWDPPRRSARLARRRRPPARRSSPRRRSSRTTAAWWRTALEALAGRGRPRRRHAALRRPAGSTSRRTRASSASCRTARCSSARRARSPTAAPGATQKALAAGVPVCVVPFGRDQLEVARRVEVAGAGTRLPARQPERRAAARRASARRWRCATARARVAEGFAAAGGAAAAADAFEALARPGRPAAVGSEPGVC